MDVCGCGRAHTEDERSGVPWVFEPGDPVGVPLHHTCPIQHRLDKMTVTRHRTERGRETHIGDDGQDDWAQDQVHVHVHGGHWDWRRAGRVKEGEVEGAGSGTGIKGGE